MISTDTHIQATVCEVVNRDLRGGGGGGGGGGGCLEKNNSECFPSASRSGEQMLKCRHSSVGTRSQSGLKATRAR